jgi:outer membrane protein OmpA-like peptidoglycan-associated protein
MNRRIRKNIVFAGAMLAPLLAPDARLVSHAMAEPWVVAQAPAPAPDDKGDPRRRQQQQQQQQQQKPPQAQPPKPPQPQQPAVAPQRVQPPPQAQPVQPAQPPKPQQPAAVPPSVRPGVPAQTQPPHPQQPATAPQPIKPAQPAQTQQPPQPQQPAATPQPIKPAQPAQTQQPPQPQQPAATPQPIKPAQPAQTQQPPQPQQPAAAPQPGRPGQPATATQPVQPAQPAQPQQPASAPQQPTFQQGLRPGFDRAGPRNIEELRGQRRQHDEGGRRVIEEPDRRLIVRDNDRLIIRHDETARFRRFGGDARVVQQGGETRNVFSRPGGVQIITVTDANGRLLRRIRREPNGREVILIDNRLRSGPGIGVAVGVGAAALAAGYFLTLPPPRIAIPREQYIVGYGDAAPPDIYATLAAPPLEPPERAYALDEIRYNYNLRARMRRVVINTINFETGSWELSPDQAGRLQYMADAIRQIVSRNPNEVFLIEGHTDAVGPDEDNLSLSDRRAETIATILTEQFQIPPENLTTQGYGEQHLLVPNPGPEPANRRVEVIRITPLLAGRQQ